MKNLILFVGLVSIVACSKGGDDASNSQASIYGDWYYMSPLSTSNKAYGLQAKINEGRVEVYSIYAYGSNSSAIAYYRKAAGSYTKEGDVFDVTYEYETCNPVHREKLVVYLTSDGKLSVKGNGFEMKLIKGDRVGQVANLQMLEDTGCNILSKLEKSSKRIPASDKTSIFYYRN